MLIFILSYVNI